MRLSAIAQILLALALGASAGRVAGSKGLAPTTKAVSLLAQHTDAAQERIDPELEPESDEKFMGKDYPEDRRPGLNRLRFGHPYPIVQESNDYDKDFVKDENDDNGEWKAQMEYDTLRIRWAKEKRDVEKSDAKMADEKKEMQAAKEDEAKAEAASKEAEEKADYAKGRAQAAEKKAESEESKADQAGGAVGAAEEQVEKDVMGLEECKRQLAEAEARLKHLLAEKDKREARKLTAAQEKEEAISKQEAAQMTEQQLEEKMAEEKKEHTLAVRKYEEKKAQAEKTEAKLDDAAEKLRKYRRDPRYVDPDGGVYRTDDKKEEEERRKAHKSGASGRAPMLLTALAAATTALVF